MDDMFRVRLNCIDHYQTKPTIYDPQLRNDVRASQISKEPRVPVIRVFGSTETGQKVCAHIHGVFPYLYVEYHGPLDRPTVGEYICRFHSSIDRALALSYRKNRQRFVARITLVKGIPFYGFHVGYRFYLKIYMLNPMVMTRLADLLQQGLIMSQKFQPYEAHIQYLLQFMVDYNLYGCGYIETQNLYFRHPVPDPSDDEDAPQIWDSETVPLDRITDDSSLPRASHCSIEVDICAKDILNRGAVDERRLHHDFIEKDNPLPQDLKLVHSMAGLWADETKRRKRRMGNLDPGSSIFPPGVLVPMSADPRKAIHPGWVHEEQYWKEIEQVISEEAAIGGEEELSFSNYVAPVPREERVRTVLESVEDLFPDNLFPVLGLEDGYLENHPDAVGDVEIDEKGILALDLGQESASPFPDDSDEASTVDLSSLAEAAVEAVENRDKKNPQNSTILHGRDVAGRRGTIDLGPAAQGGGANTGSSNPPPTINGLSYGVRVSRLLTGQRPYFALHDELFDHAQKFGLVSRCDGPEVTESKLPKVAKRPSPAPGGRDQPKRARFASPRGDEIVPIERSLADDQPQINGVKGIDIKSGSPKRSTPSILPKVGPKEISKGPPKGRPKGILAKQAVQQSLAFTVVKDPHNPSTRLRLSQRSGSQPSQESPLKKVSFDPLLSIQEAEARASTAQTPKMPKTPSSKSSVTPTTAKSPALESPKILWSGSTTMFIVNGVTPSLQEVRSTMQHNGVPDVISQDAFYSNEDDVPPRPKEYAGKEFRLIGNSLPYLPEFDATGQSPATFGVKPEGTPDFTGIELEYERQQKQCSLRSWEIAEPPPTFREVSQWWAKKQKHKLPASSQQASMQPPTPTQKPHLSQIAGATPKNKHGFKYSQKRKSTSVRHEAQYMSTMSLEIHINTRGKLLPNPEEDEVQCIFWCLRSDESAMLSNSQSDDMTLTGIIVLSEDGCLAERIQSQTSAEVAEESSELDLMVKMVEIVRTHDPDILAGYEVHGGSWGYLVERARLKYEYNLCDEFSRIKSDSSGKFGKDADRWGFNTTSTIHVTGRHVINVWRAMRGELNLLQYTMENVAWHLLHRRIPRYSWKTLTDWYVSGGPKGLSKLLRYHLGRTKLNLEILEANELVPRTSEQARLLGVDFFSVFSRGSQFKVESIMLRIAKPENFVLVSPSRKQVGSQNALECLPLVMEPQSAFYSSPLLVLDFQSLYPSVMIAYNYCYSTFLGRVANWRGTNKMGFLEYKRREGLLRLLKDHINVAPNGMMYTKPEIRKSLLAKMLTEILETRVMVKSGMKQDKDDKTLQQLLHNRQLALKLLANVTYGYTSASFSGRMPCSEIADSIVQTGRETLERAIAYIHSVARWDAEVVYGDTDSLFVYLKGRTREQAFKIGAEIAKEITDMNPRPIKLKFEKVYHPCVLLAKKRYVGYKFETPDQTIPEFDAKGIETVRRDGTPAEQKIEEKALRILFETADLSQVKAYFQSQCTKIMRGAVSVQDFCFAREVKLGTYSAKGPPPPGALISTKRMVEDARAEPQYGERVPYVVISGAPGARLIDRCVAPEELLHNPDATLDSDYYIEKNLIPPLERIFNLVGANVKSWYEEMPKVRQVRKVDGSGAEGSENPAARSGVNLVAAPQAVGGKKTLERFMRSSSCVVCGVKMKSPSHVQNQPSDIQLCKRCEADTATSMARLQTKINTQQRRYADVIKVCQSCAGMAPLEEVPCESKDCPVYYTRVKQETRLRGEKTTLEPALMHLEVKDLEW
ncbi:hypothetical protein QBC34DRAFT_397046 [Podospora aff. communis PSN243]|uniref:DNA polymerase n=1 Tax=Podospora aff. communis PSN243 TaxID=3040156 RepID=A0AAV9GZN9_9PEZI|nr:hypothetical protein QBC34DRAFT_397046 [Podospora aff. communis PSN243]